MVRQQRNGPAGANAMLGRAAVLAFLLTGSSVLHAAEGTQPTGGDAQRELLDEVHALRAEVNELKAQRAADKAQADSAEAERAQAGRSATAAATATGFNGSTASAASLASLASPVVPAQEQAADSVVENDAQSHSYLFGDLDGFTGGYPNNRFVIQSADGNFALRPWLHFQFRDVQSCSGRRIPVHCLGRPTRRREWGSAFGQLWEIS